MVAEPSFVRMYSSSTRWRKSGLQLQPPRITLQVHVQQNKGLIETTLTTPYTNDVFYNLMGMFVHI